MTYVLHPEVYGDLDEIYEYIDRFNPSAADRLLDEFLAAFDSLVRFPLQGHRRIDLSSRPLRFKVIRSYLIAYLPDLEPLWIVAVLDGRRNPRVIAALLRGRE
jgi:plasmid stabilization system protein ParE